MPRRDLPTILRRLAILATILSGVTFCALVLDLAESFEGKAFPGGCWKICLIAFAAAVGASSIASHLDRERSP
jgi:hypothetical protein